MAYYGYPLLFVLFLWWFSTGAVIYLNNLPKRTFPVTIAAATLVLFASIFGLYATKDQSSLAAAYYGFAFGLLIWAWTQITFYTGVITGPRTTACPPACGGLRHFWHAVETCLYHELAAVAAGALIIAATWGGENEVGIWTYVILWAMHLSAKLNVVFGVRNLNEQFFPEHLRYLRSFLRERPMNVLFPVSVTVGTVVNVLLVQWAAAAGSQTETAAYTFYACLMALALIEHWFLVLPLPFAELWNWGLEARKVDGGAAASSLTEPGASFVKEGQILPLKLCASQKVESYDQSVSGVACTAELERLSSQANAGEAGKPIVATAVGASILSFRKRK